MKRSNAAVAVILLALAGYHFPGKSRIFAVRHDARAADGILSEDPGGLAADLFAAYPAGQALARNRIALSALPNKIATEGWIRIGATLATLVGFRARARASRISAHDISPDDSAAARDRSAEVAQSHRHRAGDFADLLRDFCLASRCSASRRNFGNLAWISSPTSASVSRSRSRRQICSFCFLGALVGTLVGVLPGLGPVGAVAFLLSLTFKMEPASAIIMLAGIYYGAMYGGSTTSILVNIPGETASVVTCLDGYRMARQGRAGAALGMAAFGSFIAGTFGVIGLMFLAPLLGRAALSFGPPEYFALTLTGLTLVAYLDARLDAQSADHGHARVVGRHRRHGSDLRRRALYLWNV